MKLIVFVIALASCGGPPSSIAPSAQRALPEHREVVLDQGPKQRRRTVPAEVVLRAYLMWFGDLAPRDAFYRAHGDDLFDQWHHYLAALGLPDHHVDAPRVSESNTIMVAALGRIGEALCVRSAEHDLAAATPPAKRIIFAFDMVDRADRQAFADRFDVVHRTFLGYPVRLAPAERIDRFYALYRDVSARHAGGKLAGERMGWVSVCTALVLHPETGLY